MYFRCISDIVSKYYEYRKNVLDGIEKKVGNKKGGKIVKSSLCLLEDILRSNSRQFRSSDKR